MSSIIRWRRSRRAGMDSGLFMGRLLLLERSQNAQCSPGAAQPGCYVSALTASSHAPLPRSGFVLRPKAEARGWLTVPVCELTVYEFKDLPNPDYPWADDRDRL